MKQQSTYEIHALYMMKYYRVILFDNNNKEIIDLKVPTFIAEEYPFGNRAMLEEFHERGAFFRTKNKAEQKFFSSQKDKIFDFICSLKRDELDKDDFYLTLNR